MQKISTYLYPNRIELLADLAGFTVEYTNVYQRNIKIYAGIDNTFPGYREFAGLANGIMEGNKSNYDDEEYSLFKSAHEIDQLIESLENKKNVKTKVEAQ